MNQFVPTAAPAATTKHIQNQISNHFPLPKKKIKKNEEEN